MRMLSLKSFTVALLTLLVPITALAQAPTCEEQVSLLQGYVQELASQRSSLEGRLIAAQDQIRKDQVKAEAAKKEEVKK